MKPTRLLIPSVSLSFRGRLVALGLLSFLLAVPAASAQDAAQGNFYQGGLLFGAGGSGLAVDGSGGSGSGEEALYNNPANLTQYGTQSREEAKAKFIASAPSVQASCKSQGDYTGLASGNQSGQSGQSGGQNCTSMTERNFIGVTWKNYGLGIFTSLDQTAGVPFPAAGSPGTAPAAVPIASSAYPAGYASRLGTGAVSTGGAMFGLGTSLGSYLSLGTSLKMLTTDTGVYSRTTTLGTSEMTVVPDDLWSFNPGGRGILGERRGYALGSDIGVTAASTGPLSLALALVAKNAGGMSYQRTDANIEAPALVRQSFSLGLSGQYIGDAHRVSLSADIDDFQGLQAQTPSSPAARASAAGESPATRAARQDWVINRDRLHLGGRAWLTNSVALSGGHYLGSYYGGLVVGMGYLTVEAGAQVARSRPPGLDTSGDNSKATGDNLGAFFLKACVHL